MQSDNAPEGRPLAKNRTMEIVVALFLILVAGIVIYDTMRLGIGWIEGQGPASGYFPFYIACALGTAGVVTLAQAIAGATEDADETFVEVASFLRVLAVLVPAFVYVGLIEYLGIYVASAILIVFFMIAIGREGPVKSLAVGTFVPVVLFMMFERWFLVPLPKGPLETLLGFN
jgi:hypothetical protein